MFDSNINKLPEYFSVTSLLNSWVSVLLIFIHIYRSFLFIFIIHFYSYLLIICYYFQELSVRQAVSSALEHIYT
jgi:hypothetical protein